MYDDITVMPETIEISIHTGIGINSRIELT